MDHAIFGMMRSPQSRESPETAKYHDLFAALRRAVALALTFFAAWTFNPTPSGSAQDRSRAAQTTRRKHHFDFTRLFPFLLNARLVSLISRHGLRLAARLERQVKASPIHFYQSRPGAKFSSANLFQYRFDVD
jgi:hypothetical protein